jgi:integrase/recombinase XerD
MTPQQQFITERRYLKSVTPATVVWYEQAFRRFEGAMDSRAAAIERIGILKERGLSVVSINCHLRVVKAFWKWSGNEGNDWKIPKLKEEQKILATLPVKDIRAILGYKPVGVNQTRAHLICLLILDCGLRISEVLSLRKKDVNLEELSLLVFGKGRKERLVPISKELRARLYRYMAHHEEDYLFPTRSGGKVTVRNIERDLKALFKRIGIEGIRASPHTVRHSFAVCYLRNGGNLEYLRRILGHSSLVTSQKYLKSLGVADLQIVHNALSPLSHRAP